MKFARVGRTIRDKAAIEIELEALLPPRPVTLLHAAYYAQFSRIGPYGIPF